MSCCSNCSRKFVVGDFMHRYTGLKYTEEFGLMVVPFSEEDFCDVACMVNKFMADLKKSGEKTNEHPGV